MIIKKEDEESYECFIQKTAKVLAPTNKILATTSQLLASYQ